MPQISILATFRPQTFQTYFLKIVYFFIQNHASTACLTLCLTPYDQQASNASILQQFCTKNPQKRSKNMLITILNNFQTSNFPNKIFKNFRFFSIFCAKSRLASLPHALPDPAPHDQMLKKAQLKFNIFVGIFFQAFSALRICILG